MQLVAAKQDGTKNKKEEKERKRKENVRSKESFSEAW